MKPTNPIFAWGTALVAALVLAACGGGGDTGAPAADAQAAAAGSRRAFNAVVSFGDSLSDVGTYQPATVVPGTDPPVYLGGRFTTNSATATVWVENVAARLGIAMTPAEVGFGGQSVRCPAAAKGLGATCTAYAQGGARVSDPNGTRHDAGALTVPIRTQIANHLERFKTFRSTDLVLVWAGANDLLWQTEQDPAKNPDSFIVRLFRIQALAQAGAISPQQAQAQVAVALQASQAVMATAAQDLVDLVRDQIVANGGRYVAVLNLPDPAVTPEGVATTALSPVVGAALTALADSFNAVLKDGLAGLPVQLIDIRALISDVVANPGAHRVANASTPACDPVRMSQITGGAVTDGFALFCNATPDSPLNGLLAGANVDTWFFADGNHPTTGGHRLIGNEVMRQLRSFGWVGEREGGGDR
jgi:phospholipase/lecithinase/hemolysin